MSFVYLQELLDPKNGYLFAEDQSLEVAVTFFVTKVALQKGADDLDLIENRPSKSGIS
jgi:hypothetical protein